MDEHAPDLMVLAGDEVDVDASTAAAIERGIRAGDEGRVVPSEVAHELLRQWISEAFPRNQR
jgi:predicted transcriptional regulator